MASKLPDVEKVTEFERQAGGFRTDRTLELLGLKDDSSLRRLRRAGELKRRGRLYTFASVRKLNEQRVKDGLLEPEYLALFSGDPAEVVV
ncbi:MAG TPA: hypothetical protein VF746_13230 [Longimicrobium sp.]|jgi:hypothetical protein